MDPEGYVRVYLPRGVTAHLIPVQSAANDMNPSACDTFPRAFGGHWEGTSNQTEYENALRLPLCTRCAIVTGQHPLR